VRKEPVPYCVNYKESVPQLVNEIYMLVLHWCQSDTFSTVTSVLQLVQVSSPRH
jgi:hypothetical protein